MRVPNPLSLRGKEAVLGVALAAGILGVAVLLRSSAAAAAATPAPTPLVITPGSQTITIPAGGLLISPPTGAVWGNAIGAPYAGTSTPIFVAPGTAGQTVTESLTWTVMGATGNLNQTATLTLTT
jgi:hypothetical protein